MVASATKVALRPGRYLREVRERLGLTLREVQEASRRLALQECNWEMYISAARLDQIENSLNGHSEPGNHRLMSLSAIYGIDFLKLLSKYGVEPDRVHNFRKFLNSKETHPVSTELHDFHTTVNFPLRMDPGFRWETTQLINRMVAVWGEIPACLLTNFNPHSHILGLVGLEDRTMFPLIRPGALIWVDGKRRRVLNGEFLETERPIYFVELREGYRCAWCQVDEGLLTLIPHPSSGVAVQSFNFPDDAEIVGQVAGIAMRLLPVEPSLEQ
jgi:transcriptional regulator with XRE-family HTH domain